MNLTENGIREFAYLIWESEGKPHGQDARHWNMACKLADSHLTGNANEYASTEPLEPLDPPEPTRPIEPVNPISPSEPSGPINPTEPFEPGEPVQPIDPVAQTTKRRKSSALPVLEIPAPLDAQTGLQTDPVNRKTEKKPSKSKKTISSENALMQHE